MAIRKAATPAIGRPSKYDPAFCDQVREGMRAGFSKTAVAGMLGIARSTLHEWCATYPAFSDAVKEGETLRTLKLETDLLSAPDGPTVTSRIFALKNAAPDEWRDKQSVEMTGANGGPIKTEEVSARDILADRLAGIASRGGEGGDTQGPDGDAG